MIQFYIKWRTNDPGDAIRWTKDIANLMYTWILDPCIKDKDAQTLFSSTRDGGNSTVGVLSFLDDNIEGEEDIKFDLSDASAKDKEEILLALRLIMQMNKDRVSIPNEDGILNVKIKFNSRNSKFIATHFFSGFLENEKSISLLQEETIQNIQTFIQKRSNQ